ncbi:hypothetical protein JI735_24655 [Paenibacillus sonchi]|uniref:Butirosin biosynthesis protein H N-terminal domain-containing protein n=1 Tax=Paenibacillus sonchi TaxID=373687 RepID=A0A974P9K0_9BACL|nr:hypothetical protein [Paenibacillus sonchi]QQZ59765.1 hypothetical protein JI735_24655 [Paenibacillus sonchi]
MLNIVPVKSTPYPTLRSCIDDCIHSVAEWLGKDSKCMYGNAWQVSFEEQQFPDQPLIERLALPRISTEALSAYHGLVFSYIERKEPEMDKTFMLDMLESRLSSGMPVLVGFDSYDCPWCVAFRKLHTSHACLAVGLDRSSHLIYLTDAYYGKPLEPVDFDVFQQACHFYALFELCDSSRSYTDWQTTLQGMLSSPFNQVQPGQVAAHLRAYADAYLNTGITADCPAEYSSSFMLAANTLPIHRIRFSLFLRLLNREADLSALSQAAEGYQLSGEQWNLINQFMIKVMCSGNKLSQRRKIHKKMHEMIRLEEQLLEELAHLTMQSGLVQ